MAHGAPALLDEAAGFRAGALDHAQLAAAWGIDQASDDARSPIRIYGALDASRSLEQRSIDLFDELEAAWAGGALPPVVFVGSPTGSGWVNAAALTATEAWTRGCCASVALQYGALRSQDSIPALPLAARSITALLQELRVRAERMQAAGSPRSTLVIWAESLGAWALLLALVDAPDLLDLPMHVHVDWVGVPGPVLADPLLRELLDRRMHGHATVGSGDQLDTVELDRTTGDVLLVHPDDPVAHLPGMQLAWRPQRHTVPTTGAGDSDQLYRRGWLPLVTALRARRTLDRVTRPPSPVVLRGRHDYRYAAGSVLRANLGLPTEDLHIVQRLVAQRAASVLDLAA